MNPPTSKLQQHQRQEQIHPQSTAQQAHLEFATGEEAIRHDAAQTALPPAIAERLRKSIEQEPRPAAPWWKRLFGK